MKPITVLLADDHSVVREGLAALLSAEQELRVIGRASTGREAVELSASLHPDVVVMDIAMPELNGVDATRLILSESPATRVVILSAYSNASCIEQVFAYGATGYLVKKSSVSLLAQAIRAVHNGERFTDPSIQVPATAKPGPSLRRGGAAAASTARALTPREKEVLLLISQGLINKQVADALGISAKTSEKHRYSIMEKLHIHDAAGLTRYAIEMGLIGAGATAGAGAAAAQVGAAG